MKKFMLATLIFFSASALNADGLGIELGPFSLSLQGDFEGEPIRDRRSILDSPLCIAISEQKQMEFVVEEENVTSKSETVYVRKAITIEPYLFGINRKGQPVLYGNIVAQKNIKEVTTKYGDENTSDTKEKKKGFFSGLFSSKKDKNKVSTINLRKVSGIRVLEDSHFEAPKDIDDIAKDDDIDVICKIANSNPDKE